MKSIYGIKAKMHLNFESVEKVGRRTNCIQYSALTENNETEYLLSYAYEIK